MQALVWAMEEAASADPEQRERWKEYKSRRTIWGNSAPGSSHRPIVVEPQEDLEAPGCSRKTIMIDQEMNREEDMVMLRGNLQKVPVRGEAELPIDLESWERMNPLIVDVKMEGEDAVQESSGAGKKKWIQSAVRRDLGGSTSSSRRSPRLTAVGPRRSPRLAKGADQPPRS